MDGVFVTLLAQYRAEWWHLFKWVCVWTQRRPLSTGAGGPMGVLGIRDSVGSRRRVLYV